MAGHPHQGIVIGGISQADPPPPTKKQLAAARARLSQGIQGS